MKCKRTPREVAAAILAELRRHEFRAGEFRENLARKHGVTRSVVDGIAQGKTWRAIVREDDAA